MGGGRGMVGSGALRAELDRHADEMVDMRRALHAHPELSFREHDTSATIVAELERAGVTVGASPTPTGAVGILEGGRAGRTVLLRADIDALPVAEATGQPFASSVDGVMHACGHDAHTAVLLGVARTLASLAEDLPGTYRFVFQPGEERIAGAQAMVDAGLFDDGMPSFVLGMHVLSTVPTGTVLSRPGQMMAGATGLEIVVTGSGGHGAMSPRQGNVVLAAADIVTRLASVVDGMASEGTSYVCSPGMLVGGTAPNVVPVRAEVTASLRWFDPERREEAMSRLRTLSADVASDYDVAVEIRRIFGTGPVVNDPAVTAVVLDAVREARPELSVGTIPSPIAASDDISVLLEQAPGCYLMVGGGKPDGSCGMHHSPAFDIDENAIAIGAVALAAAAVRLAQPDPSLTS